MSRAIGAVLAVLTVAGGIAFHASRDDRPPLPDVPVAEHPVVAPAAEDPLVPAPAPAPAPSAPPPSPSAPAVPPAGPLAPPEQAEPAPEESEQVPEDVPEEVAPAELESGLTLAAAPALVAAGGAAELTVSWRDTAGIPIIGDIEVQALVDGSWALVSIATTGSDGTASVAVTPSGPTGYRAVYPGGIRYLPAISADATVTPVPAETVPVRTCADQADVDALPRGVGCHYTSVDASVFVVGHDFSGNAWWNELAMGAYVQLTGEQAGLYQVVERVIAPGRAIELDPAEQWSCGDRCDVILQTCAGANTGFTWLQRVG